MIDTVAQCLSVVRPELEQSNIKYNISLTRPTRDVSNLDEESLYVIRQQVDSEGIYQLVVAAKMKKC